MNIWNNIKLTWILKSIFFLFLAANVLDLSGQYAPKKYKFDFGSGKEAPEYIKIQSGMLYSKEKGYGFEAKSEVTDVNLGGDALTGDFVTSPSLFKFSVALPEGNYKITVVLGDASGESVTTVKSETRRLMLESIATKKGKLETRTFFVNIRNNSMSPGNQLKLDSREWDSQTNHAITATWDNKLTLQFNDERPCLCSLEIEPVDNAITVLLIGDSTVTDQQGDGSGSWGQSLPRWFNAPVVIANHAESGQTLKAFRFQRRWEKVMSIIKPGDYVFMQFGHNDSKKTGHDGMWPAEDKAGDWAITHSDANTDYKWGLAINAAEIKRRGGIPVIVSPITRIDMKTGDAKPESSGDYPKAAKEAAELAGCTFIDLSSMSVEVLKALGNKNAILAYNDGTHTTTYGGYIYSRCIVEGIKKANLGLARYLTSDAGSFEPSLPSPLPSEFKISFEQKAVEAK
jgi:lysophospholipase L1-like esterase